MSLLKDPYQLVGREISLSGRGFTFGALLGVVTGVALCLNTLYFIGGDVIDKLSQFMASFILSFGEMPGHRWIVVASTISLLVFSMLIILSTFLAMVNIRKRSFLTMLRIMTIYKLHSTVTRGDDHQHILPRDVNNSIWGGCRAALRIAGRDAVVAEAAGEKNEFREPIRPIA